MAASKHIGGESQIVTSISTALWEWPPWVAMSLPARCLWLALYTSAEAKAYPPGLFRGDVADFAHAAAMRREDVDRAFAELLAPQADGQPLVEYDPEARVGRMTALPDRAERCPNRSVLRGWWRRFHTLRRCAVRDRHVAVLALLNGDTQGHIAEWAVTFGTIAQPEPASFHRVAHGAGDGLHHGLRDHADHCLGHGVEPHRVDPDPEPGSGSGSSDPDLQIPPPPIPRDLVPAPAVPVRDPLPEPVPMADGGISVGGFVVPREMAEGDPTLFDAVRYGIKHFREPSAPPPPRPLGVIGGPRRHPR